MNDQIIRNVNFDQLVKAYYEQIKALVDGGVDLLLPETTFDTLNLKAAIFALENFFDDYGKRLPVILSITITDASGRALSGQTTEACWNSIAHAKPLGVGLNCALGADAMRSYLQALSKNADCFIHCYPNAGLPNPLAPTGYDEKPEDTASSLFTFFCGRRHFEYGRWMLRHNSRTYSCNCSKAFAVEPREIPSIDQP